MMPTHPMRETGLVARNDRAAPSSPRGAQTNAVLLTATITPPAGVTNLSRADPEIRLNDYCKAFDFYCRALAEGKISRLIFAENSASRLDRLIALTEKHGVSQATEFISCQGLDYPPSYGRGYGEFKLIDHAMKSSRLIRELPANANIWKVTGRYVLSNLAEVISTRPPDSDFYCHCRNLPMRWIDLYVLCWNKKAYGEILDKIYQRLEENTVHRAAEQAFRKFVDENRFESKMTKRFRTIPRLEGHRGVDGLRYEAMGLKLALRKMTNVAAPWLWI